VLQTGEYERLGSNTTRKTRARVIAATNANLPQLIRDGKFREDLFYRLNVIELEVPPLAARPEDVLPSRSTSSSRLHALARRLARARALQLARQRAGAQERDPSRVPLSVDNVVTAKSLALPVTVEPADGSNIDREAIEQALSSPMGRGALPRATSASRARRSIAAWRSSGLKATVDRRPHDREQLSEWPAARPGQYSASPIRAVRGRLSMRIIRFVALLLAQRRVSGRRLTPASRCAP
jgi:hypothetical protein